MTNKNLCLDFVKGAKGGKANSMTIRDNKLYSYSTCICERIVNERGYYNFIYNATKYSTTTSRHQYYLRYTLYGENVTEVKSVPMYTRELKNLVKSE